MWQVTHFKVKQIMVLNGTPSQNKSAKIQKQIRSKIIFNKRERVLLALLEIILTQMEQATQPLCSKMVNQIS